MTKEMIADRSTAFAESEGSTLDDTDAALAERLFSEIARRSADTLGVSRPAWSAKETEILDFLTEEARAEGLVVTADALDNRIFCLPEDAEATPYTLIGSHVDSVPVGGNYDGLAGVIAGLCCLIHQRRAGRRFARPVRVIAMRGEESAWFGPCYMASKALTGTMTDEELEATHKGDGRSLADHMRDLGIDIAPIEDGTELLPLSEIGEYLELHIEQGPLLVRERKPAAVVTGIRGNLRLKEVRAIGEPGHSGAVPREFRHDPVMATAQLLTRLDSLWAEEVKKGTDLVMTSGVMSTDPKHHAMARIPDQLTFSFEIRSQDPDTLERFEAILHDEISRISALTGVRFELPRPIRNAPAQLDRVVQSGLLASMEAIGQARYSMPSGGGHDAAIFANSGVPAGMVFVRSQGGSHNPDESMAVDDLMAATSILLNYVTRDATT
ncbi:hydantoinase/carbamoylase family amidase [Pseudooceanicola sp.]|uniref:hydantoinase/carbamoylase family amidase n=1 Tax=Pseudooceanicola sp. TaxID=1914328 RepID=UPI0035C672DA